MFGRRLCRRVRVVVGAAGGVLAAGDLASDLPALDLDGSGMSDVYERVAGTVLDPDKDADGDGRTNLEEYGEGTDPWTADAGLHAEIERHGDDGLALTWSVVPGVRYAFCEWRADGGWGEWIRIAEPFDGVAVHVLPAADEGGGARMIRFGALAPSDEDGDGLDGIEEAILGLRPDDPDADNDGCADGLEWAVGRDPGAASDGSTGVATIGPLTGLVVATPDQDCAR